MFAEGGKTFTSKGTTLFKKTKSLLIPKVTRIRKESRGEEKKAWICRERGEKDASSCSQEKRKRGGKGRGGEGNTSGGKSGVCFFEGEEEVRGGEGEWACQLTRKSEKGKVSFFLAVGGGGF